MRRMLACGIVLLSSFADAMMPLFEAPVGDVSAPARSDVVITNTVKVWPGRPDRLWLELWCDDSGEDMVEICVHGGKGKKDKLKGKYVFRADLPEKGRRSVIIPYSYIRGNVDRFSVSNVTVRVANGYRRRFGVSRMALLSEGEDVPRVEEAPRVHAADTAAHRMAYERFRAECRRGAFVVGQATSMENVRPRADFKWRKADEVKIRLARCERESVQILVSPAVSSLKGVRVDVKMNDGFASSNVTSAVVGYVETKNPPPYKIRPKMETPPRGWWPDPILDFQQEADISNDDVQSFWVRVTCPEGQKAGLYCGTLTVSAKGVESVKIPFSVRVNGFSVGRVSPLPIVVSCLHPGIGGTSLDGRSDIAKRLKEDPNGYHNAWITREEKYCDFFADYYITTDSLYVNRKREPRWDMLVRLKKQGRLGLFNLCYWWYMGSGEKGEEKWRNNTLPLLRERYEKAKSLGLEKHAYFYGCDELNPSVFSNVARTVTALHREFPGVPIMTTARDALLGTGDSLLDGIDIHCPALCFWENRPVREAQRKGRQVWWYFCNTPAEPWANTTLEGPPIEIRSLMGAQTQKFKPDGFLYYATMNWNSLRPIAKGPFTDWNPRSFGLYHGDGQWTCCGGPDMLPLATIRLENFRDGLEDLWYVRELERIVSKMQGNGISADWLKRAHKALAVPAEVARSVKSFSIDPEVLYRWRDSIADLIDASGEGR